MAGYIGSKTSVTQVDGYNRTEADGEFVNDPNSVISVSGSSVGIGTSSPSALLDVLSVSNPSIKVRSNGGAVGNYAELTLQSYNNYSGSGQAFVRGLSSASGNSNTDLVFGTNASGFGAPEERMRIDGAGKVRTVAVDGGNTFEALELNNIANVSSAGTGVQLKFKLSQTQNAIESRKYAAIEGVSPVAWGEQVDLRFVTQPYASSNNVRETMRIDGHGRVTMPYQPSFCVGDGQTVQSGSSIVKYQGVRHNIGGHYNVSNGRFTAPVTGVYHFECYIQPHTTTFSNYSSITWQINGGQVVTSELVEVWSGGSDHRIIGGSIALHMNASDYMDVNASRGYRGIQGYMSGHLIG